MPRKLIVGDKVFAPPKPPEPEPPPPTEPQRLCATCHHPEAAHLAFSNLINRGCVICSCRHFAPVEIDPHLEPFVTVAGTNSAVIHPNPFLSGPLYGSTVARQRSQWPGDYVPFGSVEHPEIETESQQQRRLRQLQQSSEALARAVAANTPAASSPPPTVLDCPGAGHCGWFALGEPHEHALIDGAAHVRRTGKVATPWVKQVWRSMLTRLTPSSHDTSRNPDH